MIFPNGVDGGVEGFGGVAACDGALQLHSACLFLVSRMRHTRPVDNSPCALFHCRDSLVG